MIIYKNFSKSVRDMSVEEVCSHYKFSGIRDHRLAFDFYLIDSGLRPACDAIEFHKAFEASKPFDFRESVDFVANVFDLLIKMPAMASRDSATKVWTIIWQSGLTGSYPPCSPPDPERFIPISKMPYDNLFSNDN